MTTTTTTGLSLQLIHNNAFDSLLLRDSNGVAVSRWTVADMDDFLLAVANPASLDDFDIQDPDGVEFQEVEDYGQLVATVADDGLTIDDETGWENRCEFYGISAPRNCGK